MVLLWAAESRAFGAGDLKEIQQQGVLRHLGVTYANFVRKTPNGYDGMDIELMKQFAKHLGVKYQFVNTTWENLFTDLTGREKDNKSQRFLLKQTQEIKGDIIANGLTILPWRQEIISYSLPTFPTGVWLVARANSSLMPIIPSGDMVEDIKKVKSLLIGKSVLTMNGTCLAASDNGLDKTKAIIKYYTQTKIIDDIAPAMINGMADSTLLDIPDALVALEKWPGEIKIIGPISDKQQMGVAVRQSSTGLLAAFNEFFRQIWADGTYRLLVEKYYPSVFLYFGDFFNVTDIQR